MLNSGNRMDFIIEYIRTYENKIKQANSAGLFDNAKLFELFAQNICKLWYGQKFFNLNNIKKNYPCVDLLSEDRKIYIQVSTQENIRQKIRNTLETLSSSQCDDLKDVDNPVFFILSNESEEKLSRIDTEKYHFDPNKNFVSTNKIIEKAQSDFEFQEKLYELLRRDIENINCISKRLDEVIDESKNVYFDSINTKIADTLECDRTSLINQIKHDNNKVVIVRGNAGAGKSALCKKLLENEKIVLFARAEKLIACNYVDSIWNINLEDVARYACDKKIYLYIDALEYLADCSNGQSSFDLLLTLIRLCGVFDNLYLVISCRTCDYQYVVKLLENEKVKTYNIPAVDDGFIQQVCVSYPCVNNLLKKKEYKDILGNLFCLNEFVTKNFDINKISDISDFREYLWDEVICFSSSAQDKSMEVKNTIEKIVLERAKRFEIGVLCDDLDNGILQLLKANNVITFVGRGTEKRVRLKYDIYEDICFERIIDRKFQECKGEYAEFFEVLESFGRCIYRRYQIWVENKLFAKVNRYKFLYSLIFSHAISEKWKVATEVGIVKSQYCEEFFNENGRKIIDDGLLSEFVKTVNLYAFEFDNKENVSFSLLPIGFGRTFIVKLILENQQCLANLDENKVLKLFYDYAHSDCKRADISKLLCKYLSEYVSAKVKESFSMDYFALEDNPMFEQALRALYFMPEETKKWLKNFWLGMTQYYTDGDAKRARFAEDILFWTIKNVNQQLMDYCYDGLCNIAELLWTQKRYTGRKGIFDYVEDRYSLEKDYGLNDKLEGYESSVYAEQYALFLMLLIRRKPLEGLEWIVMFVNKAIGKYAQIHSDCIEEIELYFPQTKEIRKYIGNDRMWLAGVEVYQVPNLLGDIVYLVSKEIISCLDSLRDEQELCKFYLSSIKKLICEQSNNILLLRIIENIGLHFENEYPGYALELASNVKIPYYDTQRWLKYYPLRSMLIREQQIIASVGVPNFEKRYELDGKCAKHLQEYVGNIQLYHSDYKQDCYAIFDYMYSKFDKNDGMSILQIQKMDLRNAGVNEVKEGCVVIPKISGSAKDLVDERNIQKKPYDDLCVELLNCGKLYNQGIIDTDRFIKIFTQIFNLPNDIPEKHELIPGVFDIIDGILRDKGKDIDKKFRTKLCDILLDKWQGVLVNKFPLSDHDNVSAIFCQIQSDIDVDVKNRLLRFMFEILVYDGDNNLVKQIRGIAPEYLSSNLSVADTMFKAILMYAKGIEKDSIFNNALFENVCIKDTDWNKYDIYRLCNVVFCGLHLNEDELFDSVFEYLICVLRNSYVNREHYEQLIYLKFSIVDFLRKEIVDGDDNCFGKLLDILFEEVDFDVFTRDIIEFYNSVFHIFLPTFFDTYSDRSARRRCRDRLRLVEERINQISNEQVKKGLYKSMILAVGYDGDWSKIQTNFSYDDKVFLQEQFEKYGVFYPEEMICTIYQLHIKELLPEILLPISSCWTSLKENDMNKLRHIFYDKNGMYIIKDLITQALRNSERIKSDKQFIVAYENILSIMIGLEDGYAAVVLDEFRIH